MSFKTAFGMTIATAAISALWVPSETLAANYTNTSGTICQEYNAGEANYMDRLPYATRSAASFNTYVICPLSRDTTNSNGAYAYVDIYHAGWRTTTCTFYSYGYTGTPLGSYSRSWTGSGFHEIVIPLTGAGRSNYYSDYAVLCYIPGSYNGQIRGVDLSEL